jgi:hypothetical protein
MSTDKIEYLVDQAHKIFNRTSIYEVCDLLNRQAAVDFLNDQYSNPDPELINHYLALIDQLVGFEVSVA